MPDTNGLLRNQRHQLMRTDTSDLTNSDNKHDWFRFRRF